MTDSMGFFFAVIPAKLPSASASLVCIVNRVITTHDIFGQSVDCYYWLALAKNSNNNSFRYLTLSLLLFLKSSRCTLLLEQVSTNNVILL